MSDCISSVMLGHAVGDALGVPVEFRRREYLKCYPVTDMTGFGTYKVPAGCWSDDTSMSLCALESLAKGTVDFDDIMHNFGEWLHHDRFTATDCTFDFGNTCANAIDAYFHENCPAVNCGRDDELSNGNGSLMRINPFVLYAYCKKLDDGEFVKLISQASRLTHAHPRSIDGCVLYAFVLKELLSEPTKHAVYTGLKNAEPHIDPQNLHTHYHRVCEQDIAKLDEDQIKSSGYVVDTLEAALWSLLTTNDYKSCVLKAVNLGGDTDTVSAVAGGLAGALYSASSIPDEWLHTLIKRDYIEDLCERAARAWR